MDISQKCRLFGDLLWLVLRIISRVGALWPHSHYSNDCKDQYVDHHQTSKYHLRSWWWHVLPSESHPDIWIGGQEEHQITHGQRRKKVWDSQHPVNCSSAVVHCVQHSLVTFPTVFYLLMRFSFDFPSLSSFSHIFRLVAPWCDYSILWYLCTTRCWIVSLCWRIFRIRCLSFQLRM